MGVHLHVKHRTTTPGRALKIVALDRHPLRVGRGRACEIPLRDDEVTREHAQVWLDNDGDVRVRDLGSKNGSSVDGGPVFRDAERVVRRVIRVGAHELHIVRSDTSSPDEFDTRDAELVFGPDVSSATGDLQIFPATSAIELSQARLQQLMQLTAQISGGVLTRRELLDQALEVCMTEFNFERGMIALRTERGASEPPVLRNVRPDQVCGTFVRRAMYDGERTVVNDAAAELEVVTDSIVSNEICSALCVPISFREETLGVIYGDRRTSPTSRYEKAEVDYLAAIAQQVGIGLANLRLFADHVKIVELERERAQARDIQQELLPDGPLEVGGLRFRGFNDASSEVGGDYFDYLPLPDGRAAFVIADVVGHGLPAALLASNLQAAVRVALVADAPLPDIVQRINRLVCRNTSAGNFITAIFGVVEPDGAVTYVSAGHHGPISIGVNAAEGLEPDTSLPLGIDEEDTYVLNAAAVSAARPTLLFYTDGVLEARGPEGDLLGLERAVAALSGLADPQGEHAIATACEAVQTHLSGGGNDDDMTLLTVERV